MMISTKSSTPRSRDGRTRPGPRPCRRFSTLAVNPICDRVTGAWLLMRECTAAVFLGPGRIEMRSFPLPQVGSDDGLLRIEATGVCGSDVVAYTTGLDIYRPPCVLGHEMVGRIAEIGSQAASRWGLEEGDLVVVEEYLPCGTCAGCLRGDYQMCLETRYGGKSIEDFPSLWGGYSEYLYLDPRALIHKVQRPVAPHILQLFIPISNGIYWAQEVGGCHVGDTVVIIGPGPHGLGCVIGAREAGAEQVILVGLEHDAHRLSVGRALGANHAVIDDGSVEKQIQQLTDGRGANVVINLAASSKSLSTAFGVAAPRATVVQIALAGSPAAQVDVDQIVYKLLTVRGALGRPSRVVDPALRLIESGKYPLEQLVTHTFKVSQTEGALRALASADPSLVRASIVNPESSDRESAMEVKPS